MPKSDLWPRKESEREEKAIDREFGDALLEVS